MKKHLPLRFAAWSILLLSTVSQRTAAQTNYISVDPFLPLFGTYQVHYERAILPKLSVSVGFGYKHSSGAFEINGIKTENINLDDIDFNGYKFLPEARWYWSKMEKGITGFYTGVYYKYQKNFSMITGQYTASDGSVVSVDMDLNMTSNTGGIEIGYKLRAWKGLCIDFIIAGAGLGYHRMDFSEEADLPENFYQRFNEAAEQYSVFNDLKPELKFNKQDLEEGFLFPHFRYGIKVGWAF